LDYDNFTASRRDFSTYAVLRNNPSIFALFYEIILLNLKQRNFNMTQVLYGERISRQGKLRLGCSAAIFDEHGRIFLTRRTDNGQWCLPGGGMDAGESVAEACEREVWEETGLRVRVKRLVGVYSHSDQLVVYPDGNKAHIVALHFEAEIVSGEAGLSNETTDFGYFTEEEIQALEFLGRHKERIFDTLEKRTEALIK
jgi:8-oxo-dGTP pyrophosphatase MutT (NUDIX family)